MRIKEREEAIFLITMDPKVCGKLLTLHRRGNDLSWTESKPGDLGMKSEMQRGVHEAGGRTQGAGAPPPSWAPWSSTDVLLPPIYTLIPKNIRGSHETTFPLPQPSVPVRSHLGAFSGDLPEGESVTEGFYINTIASPMMCE